jgi:hypothetical protein
MGGCWRSGSNHASCKMVIEGARFKLASHETAITIFPAILHVKRHIDTCVVQERARSMGLDSPRLHFLLYLRRYVPNMLFMFLYFSPCPCPLY